MKAGSQGNKRKSEAIRANPIIELDKNIIRLYGHRSLTNPDRLRIVPGEALLPLEYRPGVRS